MELSNSFEVDRPISETWEVLTNIELIAPCLPGAQLTEVRGEDYHGVVKVKVGPISAQFKGTAQFLEKDDQTHKAVLSGKGRDARGAGTANALITAQLEAVSADVTRVSVDTDLKITGKFAQFGRGVMADISSNLMAQFAQNLAEMLAQDSQQQQENDSDTKSGVASRPSEDGTASKEQKPTEKVRKIDMPEAESIDLIEAAGVPLLKRVAPLVGVVVALLVVRRLLRGCRCCQRG